MNGTGRCSKECLGMLRKGRLEEWYDPLSKTAVERIQEGAATNGKSKNRGPKSVPYKGFRNKEWKIRIAMSMKCNRLSNFENVNIVFQQGRVHQCF